MANTTYHAFLCAGLGNRLFQYASIKGIAKKHNVNFNVIGQETVREHDNNKYEWFMNMIHVNNYINSDWRNIKEYFLQKNMEVYEQYIAEHIGYNEIELDRITKNDNILFLGFYQSEKYFNNVEEELREELKEPEFIKPYLNHYLATFKIKNIDIEDCCIIHVRLKDKLHDPRHFVHYGKYYTRAINEIKRKNPNTYFLVLSETPNDIQYVYPSLMTDIGIYDKNYTIVPRSLDKEKLELFDLYLLTRIPTIICSCSTFVWWGAWLNPLPFPEKQIYLPSRFTNDATNNRVDMKGAIIIDVD